MSKVNGQLVTCDRCKKQIFLKAIGEGEMDGGFTRWTKFEDFPKGWYSHYDVGDLCPECADKYKQLLEDIKKQKTDFMNREA